MNTANNPPNWVPIVLVVVLVIVIEKGASTSDDKQGALRKPRKTWGMDYMIRAELALHSPPPCLRVSRLTLDTIMHSIRIILRHLTVILGLAAVGAAAAPQTIKPGEIWPDNRGQHIQAHGGGILKLGDTWFWFGEDRSRGQDRTRRYVSCYSSKDLAHWTFRNQVIKLANPENFPGRWVLERPKVFYNSKTKTFVMYMHIDADYKLARVGVATCDTVDGDYKYLKSFRPLGHESRDIGQFIDDDASAYLIFEDRPFGFRIARLSDDYLTVEKEVCLIREHLEGGAIVHYNGLYYCIGSQLTGWNPNPNKYATARGLEGPWSEFKDIAPSETKTYGSQSTMMLKVVGTKATTVIFLGDIWKPRTQWDSRYLWMPLQIGDGKLWLPQPAEWTLDVETGEAVIKQGS